MAFTPLAVLQALIAPDKIARASDVLRLAENLIEALRGTDDNAPKLAPAALEELYLENGTAFLVAETTGTFINNGAGDQGPFQNPAARFMQGGRVRITVGRDQITDQKHTIVYINGVEVNRHSGGSGDPALVFDLDINQGDLMSAEIVDIDGDGAQPTYTAYVRAYAINPLVFAAGAVPELIIGDL